MAIGPEALLVAARVNLRQGLDAAQIEQLAQDIESALRGELPHIREVFLDPTSRGEVYARRLERKG
jgi:divalent metal cation (Fe/Co/Zn/Cd) transporter